MHQSYDSESQGPLHGFRVIDMTRLAAGNMMTHMLADFGAEVIKIERPGRGDDLRRFGTDESWWKVYARSKKSLSLDFSTADGREILLRLIKSADVLSENFLPGTLERWKLGPDELWELNPGLIIVRISGWGQTGPYAHKPGFGSLIEGMSGFAAMTGWEDRPPLLPPLALADMVAGITGFGGIQAALISRLRGDSRGQVIDLSLFEPLFAVLGPLAAEYETTGVVPRRTGNRGDVAAPRNVYPTSDGKHVAMSASMQSMWEKLAIAIDRPELIQDEKYATSASRVENAEELDDIIAEVMRSRTLEENLAYYETQGVTVGPILDIEDLIDHPYIRGRNVLEDFDDPDLSRLPMHHVFPRLSETPGVIRSPAPAIGQDNNEILESLGYDRADIDKLTQEGVI